MPETESAKKKICERCGKKSSRIRVVDEIVDRFEEEEVRACPKCAKKINEKNALYG